MTFHTKFLWVQYHCVLGLTKKMDLLKFMMKLDFNHECCDKVCDRIKYLISEKSGITDSINHNLGSIRIHIIFYL